MTLTLLFLAGVVNFLDRASLSVANTTIRGELHLDATGMGWLLTAFSLAYGLAQLPLIGLLDRVGTRSALGAGLVLWSAAQMLSGLVRGVGPFVALRVLLGVGEAPFYPAGVRAVREWFAPGTRGRATALMSMSQTLSLAAAPPLLTWLMLGLGWRRTFMLLGAVGIGLAGLWVALHRGRKATQFAEAGGEGEAPSAWRGLLRRRTVWGMMLGFGGINYSSWLYIAWLPGYLEAERHLSIARSGWVAAVPFLFGACGMLTSGLSADWLGGGAGKGASLRTVHRVQLVVGMVLSAACTGWVAQSTSTAMAVAGIAGALFWIHFAGTSGWGYVQAVSPPGSVAALSALQNFASFVIASAAPVVTGWLLDRTHSFSLALEVCCAVTLAGAVSYGTLAAPSGMDERQDVQRARG